MKATQICACALALAGCTACGDKRAMVVSPGVMGQSYDYTKPRDTAGKSRPVWVVPKISYGWVPARVNEAGQWVSGHQTATVVEEGHWATLEEAEMAGKPYIIAGQGPPVIPKSPAVAGPSPTGSAEIDIARLQQRIADLERDGPARRAQRSVEELVLSAADAAAPPVADSPPRGSVQVAGRTASDPPSASSLSASTAAGPPSGKPETSGSLVLAPKPAGTRENRTLPNGKTVEIEHLGDRRAKITYAGKETVVEFGKEWKRLQL